MKRLFDFCRTESKVFMKSELQLNEDILEITMRIRNHYPELSKYIDEMTITLPDDKHPGTNTKELQDYYNSLVALVSEYGESRTTPPEESEV